MINVNFPQETHPERLFVVNNLPSDRAGLNMMDFGCGKNKSVPEAIGYDILPGVDVQVNIESLEIPRNSADVIIARHFIEHTLSPFFLLNYWIGALKSDGKLILVLPDHEVIDTMSPVMNSPDMPHLHVFTRKSLVDIISLLPCKTDVKVETVIPGWSFGAVITKI